MVTANSCISRPTMPPMNSTGMNTAASETVIDRMVNATSFEPANAASIGGLPSSMCRTMFSSITMASSTTNPTASVSAISDRLSRLKPNAYITANVPMTDTGSARLGITVADTLRRKRKITSTTSPIVSTRVNFTSATDSRIDFERSLRTSSVDRGGELRPQCRHQRADRVDDLHRVGAGLALNRDEDRASRALIGPGLVVLHAVEDARHLVEAHRRAVAVGDHDRPVPGRGHQLAVGLDDERLPRAGQRAGRQVGVGLLDRLRHLVDADLPRRQLPRVEVDPHGELLGAVDVDLRDARHRGQPLRDHRLGVLVHL